jgi:nicotinate phosphoribosyltransferase
MELHLDRYELTMAQAYFHEGMQQQHTTFDYFFRKLPSESGYVVFCGLENFLDWLERFHFDPSDLAHLAREGFDPKFLEFLASWHFAGTISAVREGELVFPHEPTIRVDGPLIDAQIIETALLCFCNHQSLIATKARRMYHLAANRSILEFGSRRAHGVDAAIYGARAAYIGGCIGTSNEEAGKRFGLPISGTMAHSYIQCHNSELDAFMNYARNYPDGTTLLIDTYDVLKSGLPNAIATAKYLEQRGHRLKAIRIDSGDLDYLARAARRQLDEANLAYVRIVASNDIDEKVLMALAQSPIDIFGIGTKLITSYDCPALGGVYKVVQCQGRPVIKISEDIPKMTLPGRKDLWRAYGPDRTMAIDIIKLADEPSDQRCHVRDPFNDLKQMLIDPSQVRLEPLREIVFQAGQRQSQKRDIKSIRAWSLERFNGLDPAHKRFHNPHVYKVGITDAVFELRQKLIAERQSQPQQ